MAFQCYLCGAVFVTYSSRALEWGTRLRSGRRFNFHSNRDEQMPEKMHVLHILHEGYLNFGAQ